MKGTPRTDVAHTTLDISHQQEERRTSDSDTKVQGQARRRVRPGPNRNQIHEQLTGPSLSLGPTHSLSDGFVVCCLLISSFIYFIISACL